MAQYAWATDIHLDFLANRPDETLTFMESLVKSNPTGIFLTGDISTAKGIVYHLSAIEKVAQRPIYFVLGNHDYFGSSIVEIRKTMRELSNVSPFLRYMPTMPYYTLTPSTAVVGHDCWYDALNGDWQKSNFEMSDWNAIHEFHEVRGNMSSVVTMARKLAHEGVTHLHNAIKQAVRHHKNIVILSHYPPFRESHIHQGKVGDDNAQPWFTCKMLGDMLLDASKAFPNHQFTVLAGHTHGKYNGKINDNLIVNVGEAEYWYPKLQGLMDIP